MFHYKTLEELKQEIAAENLSVPFGDEAVLREPVTVGGKTLPTGSQFSRWRAVTAPPTANPTS